MSKITVISGTDKTIQITFKKNGVAFDITGRTVYFTVKLLDDEAANDTDAIISKDITSHSDPTNGITELVIDEADTDEEELKEYKYNFVLKDTGNKLQATQKGILSIIENVTERV